MLYAFDLLELNGEDLRPLPLAVRKARLARLLARKPLGIVSNEHSDEDGALVFRHACKMGLEGIVSKRLSLPYGLGRLGIGSRSRTRTARRCSGRARGGCNGARGSAGGPCVRSRRSCLCGTSRDGVCFTRCDPRSPCLLDIQLLLSALRILERSVHG
jgi:ATP dependent DNA ligase domain